MYVITQLWAEKTLNSYGTKDIIENSLVCFEGDAAETKFYQLKSGCTKGISQHVNIQHSS